VLALAAQRNLAIAAQIRAAAEGYPSGVHGLAHAVPQSRPGAGAAPQGPHLVYCHEVAPGAWLCEGFDNGTGGQYTFEAPFDLSGVA